MISPHLTVYRLPLLVAVIVALLAFANHSFHLDVLETARLSIAAAAAGTGIWLFMRLLRLLTPGASLHSRWLYTAIVLSLSPCFLLSVATFNWLMPMIALMLAAVYALLRAHERIVSTSTTISWLFVVFIATAAYCWIFLDKPESWHPGNLFWLSQGPFGWYYPNILLVLAPLFHPGFCVLLPLLGLLVKKTDFYLESKKILCGLFLFCVLLPAGMAQPNVFWLLPAFLLLLLILFPAWDRFIAYGFYFLKKRWMYPILSTIIGVQIGITIVWLVWN